MWMILFILHCPYFSLHLCVCVCLFYDNNKNDDDDDDVIPTTIQHKQYQHKQTTKPHSTFITYTHTEGERLTTTMDIIEENIIQPAQQFYKASERLVRVCKKPDTNEFMTVAKATLAGFVILGLIGFFIKLIHIPINHILVGSA